MKVTKKQRAERNTWLKAVLKPMTPEDLKEEVEYVQYSLRVHGIEWLDNPHRVDEVRLLMTLGHTFTLPPEIA